MSFFFEGNGFFDQSVVNNSSVNNTIITSSAISTSSIDMLNTSGNYQNITNAASPINPHDVAIKLYVDNLGISINNITLISTTGTLISTNLTGSFVITVTNLILNGPSAIFNITKNNSNNLAHIVRTVMTPGTNRVTLNINWPVNSGIILYKDKSTFDGSYAIKIM